MAAVGKQQGPDAGPDCQALGVTDPVRGLDFIEPAGPRQEFGRQVELLRQLEKPFHEAYRSEAADAHRTALERAVRLMDSRQKQAFDLSREPDAVRAAYGRPAPAAAPKRGEKGLTAGPGAFPGIWFKGSRVQRFAIRSRRTANL